MTSTNNYLTIFIWSVVNWQFCKLQLNHDVTATLDLQKLEIAALYIVPYCLMI